MPHACRTRECRGSARSAGGTRLALEPARYDVKVTQGDESGIGYRVTVTVRTLLRDLALFPDRLDPAAGVDDMPVTPLPGETAVFHVTGAVLAKPDALGTRPVPRCVNDTVARTDGGALVSGGAALATGPSEGGEFPSIPFARPRTRQPAQACANAIHKV